MYYETTLKKTPSNDLLEKTVEKMGEVLCF